MSRQLLPLDPLGLGGKEVESLTSYLFRLAFLNGVTPQELVKYLVRAVDSDDGRARSILSRSPMDLSRWGAHTNLVLDALAAHTPFERDLLASLCFVDLGRSVSRSPRCFEDSLRWCPGCFWQLGINDGPTYHRLAWTLSDIIYCSVHRIPLRSVCSTCEQTSGGWRSREELKYCIHCGTDLSTEFFSDKRQDSWQNDHTDLDEMVTAIASGQGNRFEADGPRKALDQLFDVAWESNKEEEIFSKVPRDELLAFVHCNRPISLTTARRLSFRLDVPLLFLLEGDAHGTTRNLDPRWSQSLPTTMKPGIRQVWSTEQRCRAQEAVDKALRNRRCPSLSEVARRARVSAGGLSYHFADQVEQITKRHKAHQAGERERMDAGTDRRINQEIAQQRSLDGSIPAAKSLLKELLPEVEIGKHRLAKRIDLCLKAAQSGIRPENTTDSAESDRTRRRPSVDVLWKEGEAVQEYMAVSTLISNQLELDLPPLSTRPVSTRSSIECAVLNTRIPFGCLYDATHSKFSTAILEQFAPYVSSVELAVQQKQSPNANMSRIKVQGLGILYTGARGVQTKYGEPVIRKHLSDPFLTLLDHLPDMSIFYCGGGEHDRGRKGMNWLQPTPFFCAISKLLDGGLFITDLWTPDCPNGNDGKVAPWNALGSHPAFGFPFKGCQFSFHGRRFTCLAVQHEPSPTKFVWRVESES